MQNSPQPNQRKHYARPLVAGMLTIALWMSSGPAFANDAGRLQAIKQQALALYTLRLADQRQYSGSASVLVGQQAADVRIQRVRIAIDGKMLVDYPYHPSEAALLSQSAMHKLGLVDLSGGTHEVFVEVQWAGREQAATVSRTQQTLRLDRWPRGFSITLIPDKTRSSAQVALQAPVDGGGVLRSARFESAQGHALNALSQLQMLAHIDPALSATAPAQELLARSLQGWELNTAAEGIWDALSDASDADQATRIRARLQASELALQRGDAKAAAQRLGGSNTINWPVAQQSNARMLEVQGLLTQGKLNEALQNIPADAPDLWRYNVAVALLQAGQVTAGESQLHQLAIGADAGDEYRARIQDLARLKLGYQYLSRGNASGADDVLSRMRIASPYTNRALLGRGWSKLLPLATSSRGELIKINDDGFRPQFVQAIDAALRLEPISPAAAKAVNAALGDWARLQDEDPMDAAVQEALVATPYALLKLGDYDRAIQYSEKAIERLSALRDNLKASMRRSRTGLAINGIALVRQQWPPAPAAWAREFATGAWWRVGAGQKLAIPQDAFRPRLLLEPDTVNILAAMNMLNEVEQLMDAVAEHPDLANRATTLRKRIEAERAAQQKALDRHAYYWMRQELDRATRYLIMARFSLGHAYAHQDDAPPRTPANTEQQP